MSNINNLSEPLIVVAHDAGAANIILGWVRDCLDMKIHFSLSGPACQLFSQEIPLLTSLPLSKAFEGAKLLLSGTSGHSDIEHNARVLARHLGIPSIGVIDHWVNYRERFIRNNEVVLPDEVWVTDRYAFSKAKQCFPDVNVQQKSNRFLENILEKINACVVKKSASLNILYVSEPINSTWGHDDISGEFQALEYFLGERSGLFGDRNLELRLRLHPSETRNKYDRWLRDKCEYIISTDHEHSLAESIAWADLVVGCQTYAMVIALHAGKHVLSSLPPWAPPSSLPHTDIQYLRDSRIIRFGVHL